jgi:hypothetical protein
MKMNILVDKSSGERFFSPDGNGILFIFSLKIKRYSVQQETASFYNNIF